MKFVPTFLFIKRHTVTGLKYFGKTYSQNPYYYKGSGNMWKSHIKKYGDEIETVWVGLFHSLDELCEFAEFVSEEFNIVESPEWANSEIENGLNGSPKGRPTSLEARQNLSKALTGKKMSETHKQNSAKAKRMACTIDGEEIFPSVVALIKAKGQGKQGLRHPGFKFI